MDKLKLSRRKFIKGAAAATAVGAAIGPIKALSKNDKVSDITEGGVTYKQTWCEMCFWNCGLTMEVLDGKVQSFQGQPLNPNNYGKMCARGQSGLYQLNDPDRLKHPLIRVGKRGEGKFKKATWDEAYSYIADKVNYLKDNYGPETFSLIAHGTGEHAFITVMELLGSHNVAIPSYSQCNGSREIGWYLTYGKALSGHECFDGEHSKCMMFVGRNVLESLHVGEAQNVVKGLSKGSKLIYVDPRFTKTAAKADYFLQINPGTDLALILTMISYVIKNNLYDEKFVENSCYGFDELKEYVSSISLGWGEKETGIHAKIIEEATLELAKSAPHCFIMPPRRTTRYGDDTQFVRAIAILNALFGNWEIPGGIYNISSVGIKGARTPQVCEMDFGHEKYDFKRADGAGADYPISPENLGLENKLMEAILTEKPYPVKGLFVYGTNMVMHMPDLERTKKIIDNLDLLVCCDIYLSDTALYSDVILPESTYLERDDPLTIQEDKYPFVKIREAGMKPLHDTKGAWQISEELAAKLGFKEKFKSIDEYNKEYLDLLGVPMEKLKKDGVYVFEGKPYRRAEGFNIAFPTKSKKVELYSKQLELLGHDPIPTYTPPDKPKKDEYTMLTGRHSFHTHARTQNNKWLLALHNYEINLIINSIRAKENGIKDGDYVKVVQGDKKSDKVKVELCDGIHYDAIYLPYGFGHISKSMEASYKLGINAGDFNSNETDPISGSSAFQRSFVKIEKA